MNELKKPTDEELHRYLDELPDLLDGEDESPDGRFPDGTAYDYDHVLRAPVETAPDGRRYIVQYEKGQGLVRVKELVRGAA